MRKKIVTSLVYISPYSKPALTLYEKPCVITAATKRRQRIATLSFSPSSTTSSKFISARPSFTLAWTDIAKTAPSGGRPSLHISLKALSRLAQRLAGDGRVEWGDDGFSPLSSRVEEYLVTSSSVEIDHERSGGTVPSSVEKRQDPNFSL
ncbi:hypothetical protein VE03_10270 [Pseudogymnoascus sp. 23342-1-I1]|nr:hypothetical protein VE03_10270 [Pseudogymnoascus sp. 23342-1-I1]